MTRDTVAGLCQISGSEESRLCKGWQRVERFDQPLEVVGDPVLGPKLLDLLLMLWIVVAAPARHLDRQVADRGHHLHRLLEVVGVGAAKYAGLEHRRHRSVAAHELGEIGRASCRERVEAAVGAGYIKRN